MGDSKINLFSRIEKNTKENFTTETLAYILINHKDLKIKFIRLLTKNKDASFRERLKDSDIVTQESSYNGIFDICFNGKEKLIVEIKVDSKEQKNQIARYSKEGYVAYLTRTFAEDPKVDKSNKRYLGHFYWQNIYNILKSHETDPIIGNFMEYLRVNNMATTEEISKDELSIDTFKTVDNYQYIVKNILQNKKIQTLLEKLKFRHKKVTYHDSLKYVGAYHERVKKNKHVYITAGITYADDVMKYFIEIHAYGRRTSDHNKINRCVDKFSKGKWMKNESQWFLYKYYPIPTGKMDKKAIPKLIDVTIKELKYIHKSGIIEDIFENY